MAITQEPIVKAEAISQSKATTEAQHIGKGTAADEAKQKMKQLLKNAFMSENMTEFEIIYKDLKRHIEFCLADRRYVFDNQFFQRVIQFSQMNSPIKSKRITEIYGFLLSDKRILD